MDVYYEKKTDHVVLDWLGDDDGRRFAKLLEENGIKPDSLCLQRDPFLSCFFMSLDEFESLKDSDSKDPQKNYIKNVSFIGKGNSKTDSIFFMDVIPFLKHLKKSYERCHGQRNNR